MRSPGRDWNEPTASSKKNSSGAVTDPSPACCFRPLPRFASPKPAPSGTLTFSGLSKRLRLYAAAHGKLPGKLADITEVPIPIDPFTGQPLDYRLDGDQATLTVPPPAGEPAFESNSRRFEITLKK